MAFTTTIDIPARFKNCKAVGGKVFIRKPPKRVDYLMRYTRNFPLVVVEAKAAYKAAAN